MVCTLSFGEISNIHDGLHIRLASALLRRSLLLTGSYRDLVLERILFIILILIANYISLSLMPFMTVYAYAYLAIFRTVVCVSLLLKVVYRF